MSKTFKDIKWRTSDKPGASYINSKVLHEMHPDLF